MKKLVLTTALLISGLAGAETVHLDNTDVFNLNDERSQVQIMVAYPGKELSGLCDIELRSDRYTPVALSQILEKLKISYVFSETEKKIKSVSYNVLRVPLMPGTYLDGFVISTRDGASLAKAIQDTLGAERTVVAIARTCP